MSKSSDVNANRKLGSPMRRSSGWLRTASCIAYDVSKMLRAERIYPSRPVATIPAHVAASRPLERDPSIPGEQYLPPVHPVWKKYWPLRSARSLKSSGDVPFSP